MNLSKKLILAAILALPCSSQLFAQHTAPTDITYGSSGAASTYLNITDTDRSSYQDLFTVEANGLGANTAQGLIQSPGNARAQIGVTEGGAGVAFQSRIDGNNPGVVVLGSSSRNFVFGQNFDAITPQSSSYNCDIGTSSRRWGKLYVNGDGGIDQRVWAYSQFKIKLGNTGTSPSNTHAMIIEGEHDHSTVNYLTIQGPTSPDLFIVGPNGRVSSNVPNLSQSAQLQVRGDGSSDVFMLEDGSGADLMTVGENGEVQIGHDGDESRRLVVNGNGDAVLIERESGPWTDTQVKFGISSNTGTAGLRFQASDDNGSSWSEALHIGEDGNIGIGTTDMGTYKLAVEGKIGAREVRVTQSSWADFVFEDDYALMNLSEVEAFIQEHKHLPSVPSAQEVLEGGLNLGEMDAILLQKIEELTLYVLELKKENQQLKASQTALRADMHQLKGGEK